MYGMASRLSLDDWIAQDSIPFSVDPAVSIDAAVDRIVTPLVEVELLAFAEALHGSEEILTVRNRVFQRLAEAHGYSAVVIEVTSPQARVMNDYVLGLREGADPAVREWLASGFGTLTANEELLEWMRAYNSEPAHATKLHFYGFDIPLGQGGLGSPRRTLDIALAYLDEVDPEGARRQRERLTPLIGDDGDWEKAAAMFDPAQSIGLSESATELRIATEDLITQLSIRRPELVRKSGLERHTEALHHAQLTRTLLDAHAALARPDAYSEMLGLRDLIMADHLRYLVDRERGRGKVLAFASAGHLKKRGRTEWPLAQHGGVLKEWWPAGTQLALTLGPHYAVIAQALRVSEANAIGEPEPGTLESRLTRLGGAFFIPTHAGRHLSPDEIAAIPIRTGSTLNPTYFVLTPESFEDFDWLVVFDLTSYPRGAMPLTAWNG